MTAPNFRERLRQELEVRRSKNPRYSLRALATFLASDHSTLSQVLRGVRPVPAQRIRSWGKKLGCGQEEIVVYIAAEHVPDAQTAQRQEQLRHWTAEALSIVSEPVHFDIVRLTRSPKFRPDVRWIAEEIESTPDQVNLAVSRLLRLGLIEMNAAGKWRDLTGLRKLAEPEFRKLALARVRERGRL